MILSKQLLQAFSLLLLASCLTISCSQKSSSLPQPVNQDQRPNWIEKSIDGHYAGQSSYALQTLKQAREKALNNAVSSMLAAKAGNTAEVSSEIQNTMTSVLRGSRESPTGSATINTTATISGKEIPVQFRVVEYWQDRENGYIYVLIEDLAL